MAGYFSPQSRHWHHRLFNIVSMLSLLLSAIIFCPQPSQCAEQLYQEVSTPRFTLYFETNAEKESTYPPVENLAHTSINILNNNYDELSRIFRVKPTQKVVLRFLSPTEFHRQTGSPSWTSAMFFNGEITVPVPEKNRLNLQTLKRALRHEYVHAVVAELSKNKAPAWLDEGIAQLIEGRPNPLLGPALREWVTSVEPIPLTWLENGFTTLDPSMVPTAYAQSLFATRTLVNSHGFASLTKYLQHLGDEVEPNQAFELAFGKSMEKFEKQLSGQLKRWAMSENRHP